jgi:hypothetical protein
MPVLSTTVAVALAGVMIGMRFKVPALIAATALIMVAGGIWVGWGFSGQRSFAWVLLTVLVLQCSYLFGLLLAFIWRRKTNGQQ